MAGPATFASRPGQAGQQGGSGAQAPAQEG